MTSWEEGWRKQRTIHIFSDIDQNTSGQTLQQIVGLAAHSDDPITIQLNTNGGQIHHAFAITQVMAACHVPVHTLALGRVYSAGLIILVTGKKRMALPGTMFMAHDFSVETPPTPYGYVVNARKYEDWIFRRMLDHFSHHTKASKKTIQDLLLSKDYYFDEDEALRMGMIDEVIKTIKIMRE